MSKISQQLIYFSLQAEYDQQSSNPLWDKSHIENGTIVSPCCKAVVETGLSCCICLKCGSDVQPEQLILLDPEDSLLDEDYLNFE